MANKDATLNDIKNGNGLKPISPQVTGSQSGLITEQRGLDSGIRKDIFTRQDFTKISEKNRP